jgi:3',5'-cyclic AMP phosphodiesterase CpdA
MKNPKLFLMLLLIIMVAACARDQLMDNAGQMTDNSLLKVSYPKVKIAVISDLHYLDESLMPDDYVSNPDFQAAMSMDRKLIELSGPILTRAFELLVAEAPDIVLITGDLTYNGEYASHLDVAGLLGQLESNGIKVYVVPGNNDILNPDALNFSDIPATQATGITPEQFVDLYGQFGYDEAIYTDENSLSYICEPCEGLWILGIDNIRYTENDGEYVTSPELKSGTLAWIVEKMAVANAGNITVLPIMHYGIMEHYAGQNSLEQNGLIPGRKDNAIALMEAGIRFTFTGHFHGNDITSFSNEGLTLTDIETGSLVTPPSPYRIMTLDDNYLKIETGRITGIDSDLTGDAGFIEYSDSTVISHLTNLVYVVCRYTFGLPSETARAVAPFYARAFMATFAGDEKLSPLESTAFQPLEPLLPSFLVTLYYSIWNDLPPLSDNKIHIKIE